MGHIQHRNIARSLCFLLIGGGNSAGIQRQSVSRILPRLPRAWRASLLCCADLLLGCRDNALRRTNPKNADFVLRCWPPCNCNRDLFLNLGNHNTRTAMPAPIRHPATALLHSPPHDGIDPFPRLAGPDKRRGKLGRIVALLNEGVPPLGPKPA